jgi:hypothetical protein
MAGQDLSRSSPGLLRTARTQSTRGPADEHGGGKNVMAMPVAHFVALLFMQTPVAAVQMHILV